MDRNKARWLIVIGLIVCWHGLPVGAQTTTEMAQVTEGHRVSFEEMREPVEFGESLDVNEEEGERERIETERHDFTQSTTLVGRGVTQLEFGYTFFQENGDEGRVDSHTGPELLVRYGIADNLEFRLRYNQVWAICGRRSGGVRGPAVVFQMAIYGAIRVATRKCY